MRLRHLGTVPLAALLAGIGPDRPCRPATATPARPSAPSERSSLDARGDRRLRRHLCRAQRVAGWVRGRGQGRDDRLRGRFRGGLGGRAGQRELPPAHRVAVQVGHGVRRTPARRRRVGRPRRDRADLPARAADGRRAHRRRHGAAAAQPHLRDPDAHDIPPAADLRAGVSRLRDWQMGSDPGERYFTATPTTGRPPAWSRWSAASCSRTTCATTSSNRSACTTR